MSTTPVYHDYDNSLTTSLTGATYTGSLSTASGTIGSITNTTSGGGGASGATLTTTSGGSLMWNNTNYTATASPYTVSNATTGWSTHSQLPQGMLKVSGDAVFDGEVTIRGVRLDERLTAIEERLGILRPNNDLEGKWEKLKALGEEYRRIEKEILEGEDIWATLKK
jgi:hypothetical protein